jgi:L-gulono-1,4-lactone dehydrogenase
MRGTSTSGKQVDGVMKAQIRATWKNHTGNQSIQPLRMCTPESVQDVIELIREAERLGCTVRAVGSGHAWSDVALTAGFLLDTSALEKAFPPEKDLMRPGIDPASLVRFPGGMRLREVNAALDGQNLALSNMGGYDGQTVAGVISTSTHGSGITFGPLSDQVCSLDIVAGEGTFYRIEPTAGVTDPARFAEHHQNQKLIQNDDWFHAVVVGMGCMGVVVSALLRVEPKYWLKEVRTLSTWTQIKAELASGRQLRENLHYELCFNPHAVNGEHRCLVTVRNKAAPPVNLPEDKLERHPLTEIASSLGIVPKVLLAIFNRKPRITPELVNDALESMVDDEYLNLSYKVFNIGAANRLPAYSMEIGVPIEKTVEAVDRIMSIAAQRSREGEYFHTAPVALRFVKASPAFMSMMQGRDTTMIELIMMVGTHGGFELLGTYEESLYGLGGRPHWGQVNYLSAGHGQLQTMYPRHESWLDIRRRLDPHGTFDSPFTKRVGISRRAFMPE